MRNPPKTFNVDIIITGNVAWNEDLTWETKLFYGLVRGHCRNDYYSCYASNEYLALLLKRDERSIRRMIAELEQAGAVFRAKGYVTSEEGDIFFSQRLIVPTELKRQFEKAQDRVLDIKFNTKKNARRADIGVHPEADIDVHLNINKEPCKNNNKNISKEVKNKPPTPLEGGKKVDVLEASPYLTLGKEQNVHLTESQRTALEGEFGREAALSLIEQLSAYIKSGVKRFRKKVDHYSVLRDWALRRREPEPVKRAVIEPAIQKVDYADNAIEKLYTNLEADDSSGGAKQ